MEKEPKTQHQESQEIDMYRENVSYENSEPITDPKEAAHLLLPNDSEIQVLENGDVRINQHKSSGPLETYEGTKYYRLAKEIFDSFRESGYIKKIVAPGFTHNCWRFGYGRARYDERLFPGRALSEKHTEEQLLE